MMSGSGARGNASNFTQLAGMRGLMANPIWSYHRNFQSNRVSVKV